MGVWIWLCLTRLMRVSVVFIINLRMVWNVFFAIDAIYVAPLSLGLGGIELITKDAYELFFLIIKLRNVFGFVLFRLNEFWHGFAAVLIIISSFSTLFRIDLMLDIHLINTCCHVIKFQSQVIYTYILRSSI